MSDWKEQETGRERALKARIAELEAAVDEIARQRTTEEHAARTDDPEDTGDLEYGYNTLIGIARRVEPSEARAMSDRGLIDYDDPLGEAARRIAELEAEIAEHRHARRSNEVQIANLQESQSLHVARIAELEAEVKRLKYGDKTDNWDRRQEKRRDELRAAVLAEREACLRDVAEQRCERDTPWDMALVAAMNAIRARPAP